MGIKDGLSRQSESQASAHMAMQYASGGVEGTSGSDGQRRTVHLAGQGRESGSYSESSRSHLGFLEAV